MDKMNLGRYVEKVREMSPLVHSITNYVTVNDCANILLACGAAPVMSDDVEDAPQITAISSGLNLNIGTLNQRTIKAMYAAGKEARAAGKPILLDPVGAGATKLRTDTAVRLLQEVRPWVVRGNVSEIKALAAVLADDLTEREMARGNDRESKMIHAGVTEGGMTRGVDADAADSVTEENLDAAVRFAGSLAGIVDGIIAVTGAIDIVTDKDRAFCIRNGHPLMSRITGSGCQLSAMTAAYISSTERSGALEAAAAAVCAMGVCGEIAAERMSSIDGNASYRNYLIDAVCNLTEESFRKKANYEVR